MTLTTIHPFKGLYVLAAICIESLRFPFWVVLYLFRARRPHPQWTLRQALSVRVVKAFLHHVSMVERKTPLSLHPGLERERFVVLQAAAPSLYCGPALDDDIKPQPLGATWTPRLLDTTSIRSMNPASLDVVLHLHGGAYVMGDGRDKDTGFLAHTLLRHAGVTHVFTPQYRLASNPGGRFPAQLQDALTAYAHLVHTLRIPPSRITISGDSAGGNLAFALLRYIAVYGDTARPVLPWPGCIWLWCPWVNVMDGMDPMRIWHNPQYPTDYLSGKFGHWGSTSFCGGEAGDHGGVGAGRKGETAVVDPKDPFVSPLGNPFSVGAPMFIQCGRAEVLYNDDVKIAQQFKDVKGNKVELVVAETAPHDIILIGHLLGFQKEARDLARQAGEFLRTHRNSDHKNML